MGRYYYESQAFYDEVSRRAGLAAKVQQPQEIKADKLLACPGSPCVVKLPFARASGEAGESVAGLYATGFE